MLWLQCCTTYRLLVSSRRRPSDEDFNAQLDAVEELASIEARMRWLEGRDVERFLIERRRIELIRQIESWNRRFAADDMDGRAERGA